MINSWQEKAIELLLEKGNFSEKEISKALSIDRKIVSEYLKKRSKRQSKKGLSKKDKVKIILDSNKAGKSIRAIQRETGISYDTISKVLKENDVEVKTNKILSDENREQIVLMYMSGMLQPEIAKEFGVSTSTVKQVIKKMGAMKFNRNTYPEKYTKKIKNEIIRLYQENTGIQKISRDLKVSQTAIRKLLAKNNIEIHPSQRYREKISEENEQKIIEMYQNGIGCVPIKNELNISRESVKNVLKKYSLYKDWLLNNIANSVKIVELYKNNVSINDISIETNETKDVIKKFLKANDFIIEEKEYVPQNISKDDYDKLISLYLEGKNMMEISKTLGINYSYVATIIKKTSGLKDKKKDNIKNYHQNIPVLTEEHRTKIKKIKKKLSFNFDPKLVTLDLSGQDLDEIPEEIFKLKKLKHIQLQNNNISLLPDFIYSMKNIEYLDLSDNKIKEIGNDIRFLKKMKTLNLKNNNIELLTKSITNLKSL